MIARQRRRLGLVIRAGAYDYQCAIMAGAHDESRALDVDLVCLAGGTLAEPDPRNSIYELAGSVVVDGLIVAASTLGVPENGPEVRELLRRLPPVPTCFIGTPQPGRQVVTVDNVKGVKELTLHLIREHGRRHIAFFRGTNLESEQRESGYLQALAEAGLSLEPSLVLPGYFSSAGGAAGVARVFDDLRIPCDAIVAANDWMAIGALEALAARGINVPETVSVVGFDDIRQARFLTPPLTTIRQPARQLGAEAVRLLVHACGGHSAIEQRVLPTATQLRRSCGCFGKSVDITLVKASSARTLDDVFERTQTWAAALHSGVLREFLVGRDGHRLAAAFEHDSREGKSTRFLSTLEALLHGADEHGNVVAWHDAVNTLRSSIVDTLVNFPDVWLLAETIFQQAHILIGDYSERLHARRTLRHDATLRALDLFATDLRTVLDVPSLRSALLAHLPALGLPRIFVSTHEDGGVSGESRLLCAVDPTRQLAAAVDTQPRFRTGDLLPAAFEPETRCSLMVKPLFSGQEPLGFCLIEIDAFEGQLYETVPELVSTTLRAIRLSRNLVEEATQRQRAEREQMTKELEIATRIQTAILPAECQVVGLELATCMLPAAEVGGDYFDILPTSGGCWLGIGDVAGHGLTTGLVMLMIQSAAAAVVRADPNQLPSRAWSAVNEVLCDNIRRRLGQNEHVTLTLIRYDKNGELCFSGAHEDIIIYRGQGRRTELVTAPGIWAGVFEDVPEDQRTDGRTELEPGDVVLLHTDGVSEALDAHGEQFGYERLCRTLEQVADRPVAEIRDNILEVVRLWMVHQADDMTLLVARYTG